MDTPIPTDRSGHAAIPRDERFAVLLGPDYAGKSSVMAALAKADTPMRLVSVDSAFLAPEHAVVADLRRATMDMLPSLGSAYSSDFAMSVLQTAVVHLRDRIVAAGADGPTVVDSYYYKILAKCRLIGIDEHPLFAWWRTFPQPSRVFYLDVSPETAWQRGGDCANRLEHHGERLERHSFDAFQSDLRKLMLEELGPLPVTFLPEDADVEQTARTIGEALADEC